MSKKRIAHKPGECPAPFYGRDCSGVEEYVVCPSSLEIYDQIFMEWLCDGVYDALYDLSEVRS